MLKSDSSSLVVTEHLRSSDTVEYRDQGLFRTPFSYSWANSRGKRIFDVVVSAPALLVCVPVLAAIALAIKCTSRGPVLFRQSRLGKDQLPFTIYKFRTMDADKTRSGSTVTVKGDSRLTGLGRLLRRFKLDELPQLYNVLRGDMSMVGPRPKLAEHEQMNLICRPGITGVATLVFAREEELLAGLDIGNVEQYVIQVLNPIKARLDTAYAENGSFVRDLSILACTMLRRSPSSAQIDVSELSEVIAGFTVEI